MFSYIYISIFFQWYKEFLNPLGFDPCNRSLNIQGSTRTPTLKMRVPLGVWRFIPSHSLAFLGACGMTPRLPSWPATLQPLTLVVNPRLGLWHISMKVLLKLIIGLCSYPFATNHALSLSGFPSNDGFILYTHYALINFFPNGRSTRLHVLLSK